MNRFIVVIFLSSLISSCCCKKEEGNFTRFHEDGRAKPIVYLANVIDSTTSDIPWSLSDEFNSLLQNQIASKKSIFISSKETASSDINEFKNPFELGINYQSYRPNEFVIFLELVQHKATLPQTDSEISSWRQKNPYNLAISARIKIVDIRSEEPKIVLQEVISENFYVPTHMGFESYRKVEWSKEGFLKTPLGTTHNKFIKKIAIRINDYLLLSKTI